MKYLWIFIYIICFSIVLPSQASAQGKNGSINGQIFLPEAKTQKRSFRGRMYRNRLSDSNKDSTDNQESKSPFIDVIVILNPLSFTPEIKPMKGVQITQKNAEFVPHVTPVTRNTVIEFINFDNFYHNVFSITPGAKFNIGRRPTNTVVEHQITRPGEIKLFCDIHAQMNATILSLDTPYFTRVNERGSYEMSGLPNGEYMLEVYHPDLPNLEEFITIDSGQSHSKNFTFSR